MTEENNKLRTNPRWFEGDDWRLELSEDGRNYLRIGEDDANGSIARIELTHKQASELAAKALAGKFTRYGEKYR